jgi:hypothetical protein
LIAKVKPEDSFESFSYNVGRLFLTKILIDGLTELATFEIRLKMIEWFAILTDLLFSFTFYYLQNCSFQVWPEGRAGRCARGRRRVFPSRLRAVFKLKIDFALSGGICSRLGSAILRPDQLGSACTYTAKLSITVARGVSAGLENFYYYPSN